MLNATASDPPACFEYQKFEKITNVLFPPQSPLAGACLSTPIFVPTATARTALENYFENLKSDEDVIPELRGCGLDFTGADLSGLQHAGADWVSSNLTDIRLLGACLVDAWLLDATMTRADLSGSSLRKALLRGCKARESVLVGAQLNKIDMSDADFRGADLHDTALDQAFVMGVDLRGANHTGSTWDLAPWNAFVRRARLGGAKVMGMSGDVTHPIDVGTEVLRSLPVPNFNNGSTTTVRGLSGSK